MKVIEDRVECRIGDDQCTDGKRVHAKKLCQRHYYRQYRTGDPLKVNKPNWKGDDAGYKSKHRRLPRAVLCVFGCHHTRYENAHMLDGIGPVDEYFMACSKCHQRYDAAIRMMQKDYIPRGWRPKGAI